MAEAVHPTYDIFCGKGWHRYTVTVEFSDMMAKKDILSRPALKKLEGEKLVSAILQDSRGKVLGLQRMRRGKWHMGPNGEPSHCDFGTTKINLQRHYDGMQHDGPNGEPALQTIDAVTGGLLEFTHINADTPCNGPNDTPHHMTFFKNGRPRRIQYVNLAGKVHDLPDDNPANVRPGDAWLDIKGNVVTAWKQRHGKGIREYTEAEKIAYAARLRLEAEDAVKRTFEELGLKPFEKKTPPPKDGPAKGGASPHP